MNNLINAISSLSINEPKYINQILSIQSNIRRYLLHNTILIPSSYYQTKIWRKNRNWYINGKSNECEKYQIKLIETLINYKLPKTDDRININTLKISNAKYPMIKIDGFEWSENFDGKIIKNEKIYYFNLKFVCDSGGAQTRTLREVYHFITIQMNYLLKTSKSDMYFINILDGDACYNNINKFTYLINKDKYKYKNITNMVFIGDLHDFQKSKIICQLI